MTEIKKPERPPNFRVVNFCSECKHIDSDENDEYITCVLYDLEDIGYFKTEWVCDGFEHKEARP